MAPSGGRTSLWKFLRRRRKDYRWPHGFSDWKWVDTIGCWFHEGFGGHDYFARGDRMFHGSYGAEPGDIVFHGSYTDNWHGGIQTPDFSEALAWLHGANGRDVWAWSK